MNILYTVFSFKVGGIEKLLIDILNNISLYNNNVYFVIINNDYDINLIEQISNRVNIILLNREPSGKKIKYIYKFTKIIINKKIDIIHCQCMNTVKFSLLSKILKNNIKLIHTVHDTKIYEYLSNSDIIIEKMLINKVIAISSSVKEDIIKRGINKEKVEIVYNAIDLKKFKYKPKKNINSESIVIGNVARLIPEKKGQDILIKAISKVKENYPNVKCLLAGAPPYYKNDNIQILKNICSEYKVEDNVVILGNIDDVPSFLDEIDIFVMPSRYDGFGIALVEAMSVGRPCIASNIDGPKEIIKNDEYGILFENENYEDLAKKINYIIDSYNEINFYHIKNYIEENYEIKSMIKRLMDIYSE